ncbi:hypothetical protein BK706_14450 [Bacillus thuringiensis serovar leesis]|nr:hypothetical protein BK706_14450 [Bacillus thuringiensis serovar leesis]
MNQPLVNLRVDFAFKQLFGSRGNEQILIEIQLNDQHHFLKRSLYYWSRLYASQMQKGGSYDSLRKTITINILNFPVFSEYETFHTTGKLWDIQLQKLLLDDLELHARQEVAS